MCDEAPKYKKRDIFQTTHVALCVNERVLFLAPRLLSVIFTGRLKADLEPSGHLSEFPRSSPISILLGCDRGVDVAAPLASRVSPLTGHLVLQLPRAGKGGTEGAPMITTASTPLLLSEQLSYIPLPC